MYKNSVIFGQIPNIFTIFNLICGLLGCWAILQQDLMLAIDIMAIGFLFDFLDGFVARYFNITSPIGKQLDSLADLVTFGILPTFILYFLFFQHFKIPNIWQLSLLYLPICSTIRLAKFNVSNEKSYFVGFPTTGNAVLIATSTIFLFSSNFSTEINIISYVILTILAPSLLISHIRFFSFKIKKFNFKTNFKVYFFLFSALLLFMLYSFTGILVIVMGYIIICIGQSLISKKNGKKT